MNTFLTTKNLTKAFGDTIAVNKVSIEFKKGEIRGLIGENGSGKSTLCSLICGIHSITDGEINVQGKQYCPHSILDARKNGISIIVQEKGTIDYLSVAENIFLGDENRFGKFFINNSKMRNEATKALKCVGLQNLDVTMPVFLLSLEQRKLIEIARAVYYEPEMIIVDETTTALSQEGRKLIHDLMFNFKNRGKAVIFISHDLPELMETCDSLSVLRDGELIANLERNQFDEGLIKRTMVGREIAEHLYRTDFDGKAAEEVALTAHSLTGGILQDVSFELKNGEILGFGGLSGSGMRDAARAVFGLTELTHGYVETSDGTRINSIKTAMRKKIGYASKDRDTESLILQQSILENLTLSAMDNLKRSFVILPSDERAFSAKQIESLSIKCSSAKQTVKELSGGNKQKVAFGKWIGNNSRVLIFDSPTRGVDIGVKTRMYELLFELRNQGYAILIVSEELPELLGMSDRMLIFKKGKIVKEFVRNRELNEEAVIEYMI